MTKAISIETALLASLPADGPARPPAAPLPPQTCATLTSATVFPLAKLASAAKILINICSSNWEFQRQSNDYQPPRVIQM